MFRKHFTREVYKVCSSYWLWTNEITGYYMKPVWQCQIPIQASGTADNEVQFVSQSVNIVLLVGNHKLATANQTTWIDT